MTSITDLLSLQGQTAIVTGAAVGIGKATSLRLAEAGADLMLIDINEKTLTKLAQVLTKYDCNVSTHIVDLSQKPQIDAFWEQITDSPGILINNAGIFPMKPFLDVTPEFLDKVMSINLYSTFWMCQHMIRKRQSQGGVIINIGSIEAVLPFRDELAHYDTSKAGVIALSRALAKEFGNKGFRINTILPGGIITPGTKNVAKKIMRLKFDIIKSGIEFKSRLPIGRFGKPDEIARMILVLASELSSYVHGAVIPVDGGFLSA